MDNDEKRWLQMRGMYANASFIVEDEGRQDIWKFVVKSDKLNKKYAGETFGESKTDDELHCIVTFIIFHREKDDSRSKVARKRRTPVSCSTRRTR